MGRRAMLMMGDSGVNYNELTTVNLNRGYISNTGTIISQTAPKEIYTDEIPWDGSDFVVLGKYATDYSAWCTIAFYDSNHDFIKRMNSNGGSIDDIAIWNCNFSNELQSASYIAISIRSYGDVEVELIKTQNLFSALQKSGTVPVHYTQS